ncbi:tetratricopeptide repeat protein [Nocardia terpenica]|uniref:phosphorylase family protein n=1 Tax=Nocardia terpenica TaxID=455432 RepID=UPI00189365C9|nr:tetratricopeptide repeat protein [Nocardia terpenica]MBF6066124.1 tetratricopeptide repeat protein [Nocardia terpenica]MBF6109185.1 tetratricopeptide repeat protein [Nocardia terpenica]MBF6116368.1 tetratricopeptide repeat protein [Nocardia terpenica]MBF6123525.1 tetratricopeptide repeat protein [Nocardia terpenica]MBF6156802.1 tetratricopeptide repeat protein [Nocardia terpenica]
MTALETEYAAVRRLLKDVRLQPHPAGTLFEVGAPRGGIGRVALAVVGAGNSSAAALAERAIAMFDPLAVLFVGIAGALHDDLDIGTVVVATKVYGYHGGTDSDAGFAARPESWNADHALEQLAHVISRGEWFRPAKDATATPAVRFRPIAAGEVVLNSRKTPLAEQLRKTYEDAAAIEMESAGTAKTAHLNRSPFLAIRSISDKADGRKYDTDDLGMQSVAARNAAIFAVEVATRLLAAKSDSTRPDGDITAVSTAEPFLLEPFPLDAPETPRSGDDVSLSVLLRGAARVVPFIGRTTERSRLSAWRDTSDRLAVMLVFGRGGQGKTRLAAQFAQDTAAAGWTVVNARHESEPQPVARVAHRQDAEILHDTEILIVVDYAERWPRPHLERLLRSRPVRDARRVRVLLLARPAGYWWKALANPLLKLGATVSEIQLGPLADTVAERRIVFAAARDRFADLLGSTDVIRLQPPGSLADPDYELVLTLHMAALVAVDAHRRNTSTPNRPSGLSAYLVQREYDHWQTLADNGRISTPTPTMARLVALATLTQSLPHPEAVDLLGTVGLAGNAADAQSMLDDHLLCYPAESGPDRVLTPLLPDRLGEDFLAELLPARTNGSAYGDAWLATIPNRLLTKAESGPAYRSAVLSVLIETGERWDHVRNDYLVPILEQRPEIVLTAGGAALVSLANYADPQLLTTLTRVLPDRHVELDGGIAALTRRLTDYALAKTADEAKKADLIERLADRLSNAGLYSEAASASNDGIAIRRRLAEADPATHEPLLVYALGNLGIDLWHVGQSEAALTAMNDAVTISRRLATAEPDAYTEDLAAALTNLAGSLIALQRYPDALDPAEDAVTHFRQLRERNPGLAHELGSALRNLAIILNYHRDRRQDALDKAREAVNIYRELATNRPEIHTVELAESLGTLGKILSDPAHPEAGLPDLQESARIFRQLTTHNPAAHGDSLIRTLGTIATRLWQAQQHEQAIKTGEEAINIGRQIAENNHTNNLALGVVLNNHAARLLELSRTEEAVAVADEAIIVWQQQAVHTPDRDDKGLDRAIAIRHDAATKPPLPE